jgi:hypothetical protein
MAKKPPEPPPPTRAAGVSTEILDTGTRLLAVRAYLTVGRTESAIAAIDEWLMDLGIPMNPHDPVPEE